MEKNIDKTMADKNNENQGTNYTLLVIFSVVVILLYLGSWFLIDYFYACPERQGQFGDKFGAVNALFSGLAFAGLIFTIILQKKELALQREELVDTRKELAGQKKQLEQQNKTLRRECFENTFYSMLKMQQTITEGLILESGTKNPNYIEIDMSTWPEYIAKTIHGRDVFYHLYNEENGFQLLSSGWRDFGGIKMNIHNNGYNWFYNNESLSFLDHYFRHLYRIIKFVDESEDISIFADENSEYKVRYNYIAIIRATLSDYELGALFYNCLSQNGRDKFKPLTEKYCFFKNIRDKVLDNPEEDKAQYAVGAIIKIN